MFHRVVQFCQYITSPWLNIDEDFVRGRLNNDRLMTLFQRMPRPVRLHGITVSRSLERAGLNDPELLTAALLHDLGKIVRPVTLPEQVMVVMITWLAPAFAERRSCGEPRGMWRSFRIRRLHAARGAELAEEAGAGGRVAELIRRHHCPPDGDSLLSALQQADDASGSAWAPPAACKKSNVRV